MLDAVRLGWMYIILFKIMLFEIIFLLAKIMDGDILSSYVYKLIDVFCCFLMLKQRFLFVTGPAKTGQLAHKILTTFSNIHDS